MGRRAYKRFQIALPVNISGLDTNGNPFKQTATTVDIGPRGMRLRGVYCLRGRGDRVKVEVKGQRADFRVAWVSEAEGLVGLEGLDDAHSLLARHLPPDIRMAPGTRADTFVVPSEIAPLGAASVVKPIPMEPRPADRHQPERRHSPRYHCAGAVRIFESGILQSTTQRMNEISMIGCYVETMSPLPAGSPVSLEMEVNGRTIRVDGEVKASQLADGMGLQFTSIAPPDKEKLAEVIAEVSGQTPPRFLNDATPSAAGASPPVEQISARQVGEAVQRWFGAHDSLSRADFLKLVEELKSAGR